MNNSIYSNFCDSVASLNHQNSANLCWVKIADIKYRLLNQQKYGDY